MIWDYREDEPATVEVAKDRVVIGMIYLLLFGALLIGGHHLIVA